MLWHVGRPALWKDGKKYLVCNGCQLSWCKYIVASVNLELERHAQNLHITKIVTPKLVIKPYTGPPILSSPLLDTTKASFAGRHHPKMEVSWNSKPCIRLQSECEIDLICGKPLEFKDASLA